MNLLFSSILSCKRRFFSLELLFVSSDNDTNARDTTIDHAIYTKHNRSLILSYEKSAQKLAIPQCDVQRSCRDRI